MASSPPILPSPPSKIESDDEEDDTDCQSLGTPTSGNTEKPHTITLTAGSAAAELDAGVSQHDQVAGSVFEQGSSCYETAEEDLPELPVLGHDLMDTESSDESNGEETEDGRSTPETGQVWLVKQVFGFVLTYVSYRFETPFTCQAQDPRCTANHLCV